MVNFQSVSNKIFLTIIGVCMASMTVASDICDLDQIYQQNGFHYSLPRHMLEKYYQGKYFPDSVGYDAEIKAKVVQDTNSMYQTILAKNPAHEKIAVITAGSPGSGKTWRMRADLKEQEKSFAYIDPDDVALKSGMVITYLTELAEGLEEIKKTPCVSPEEKRALERIGKKAYASPEEKLTAEKEFRTAMYNKYRDGSNFATHVILAQLIKSGTAFYYGTTSSSPASAFFYKFLKDNGYTIRMLHMTAPDDVRWASIKERDKTFVQTTEADIRDKAYMVPERIDDTYLKYADTIEFCFRDGVHKSGVHAATWTRTQDGKGVLVIHDKEAYAQVKKTHDVLCKGKENILWKNTVEQKSEIAQQ